MNPSSIFADVSKTITERLNQLEMRNRNLLALLEQIKALTKDETITALCDAGLKLQ